MYKRKADQSGFSSIIVLLGVLVIAAIAVSSLAVYQHHKNSSKTTASTNSPQTTTQQSKNTTTTQPTPTTTQYFTITQWDVRSPYTGTDTFTYKLSADNKLATVISKQLASKDIGCASFGAGQIERFASTDHAYSGDIGPTAAQDATQNPTSYTYVGGYYYRFVHDQSGCGSISISDQNQANNAVKALVATFQAVPTN
ncbi:MAG: hypothetical protein M3Y81_22080 [Chloroflexota bacterium]|nr:hypothetical protein [Chloroflexota bacterium]